MPLVCMSIVASAFQYGCAPTLMPATTTLISPPPWVNVMIRRSARATQSMFSVPLSIEIRAPEDSANHSTGRPRSSAAGGRGKPPARQAPPLGEGERRHDPGALRLGHGAQLLGRVTEQRHPR